MEVNVFGVEVKFSQTLAAKSGREIRVVCHGGEVLKVLMSQGQFVESQAVLVCEKKCITIYTEHTQS